MEAIIKTENLTYLYNQGLPSETAALRDVNFEIQPGELLGIIGHTGSGKSTLIQHFNGILRPTAGKIYVQGEDIWEKPKEIRRIRFKVGLVAQYPEHQLFEETVYKDIAFGPWNMELDKDEIHRRVLEAADLVGLPHALLEKSPFELSGGQRRRAAIAGVIAMEPSVLILDEPTAGLDPRGREQIFSMIKEYHRHKKNTVLLVSHSMEDVARFTNRVMVMNQAGIFMEGSVEDVFSRADELEAIGLSVPQITRICTELSRKGYPIAANTYTVQHAKEQILALLEKQKGEAAK